MERGSETSAMLAMVHMAAKLMIAVYSSNNCLLRLTQIQFLHFPSLLHRLCRVVIQRTNVPVTLSVTEKGLAMLWHAKTYARANIAKARTHVPPHNIAYCS